MPRKEYPRFDPSRLNIPPLDQREHLLTLENILPLAAVGTVRQPLRDVAGAIVRAKQAGAAVVLMIGAHVLRSGVQRYIIDLMEKGYISCLATNGAGLIHDYEFSLIGATTESVAKYIRTGEFGLWRETGGINDIVSDAAHKGLGLGEAIGRTIEEEALPYRDTSVFAAAYRLGIPATVHVGIGYDIVYEHPNCDGAAWGSTSYTDFLRYTEVLTRLEGGVIMNFGSSVMAPEIFLKALAMVRNAAHAEGRKIAAFTSLVCDLRPLSGDTGTEPARTDPEYYFRPWKTMLVRVVADGGKSYYVEGAHARTVPELWTAVTQPGE